MVRMKGLPARVPVFSGGHLIAGASQDLGADLASGRVVLDHEDALGRIRRALPRCVNRLSSVRCAIGLHK